MTIPRGQPKTAPATATTKARVAKTRSSAAPIKPKPARKATRAKKVSPARPGTKTAKVLGLLKRAAGVTLKELMKVTGWQAHSVRGFLSGTIGKKMGITVESFQSGAGERSYRISSKWMCCNFEWLKELGRG